MHLNHQQGISVSRYRQLRLTATHETSGRLSFRVHAKPLNAAWNEHSLILQGASFSCGPLMTIEDVCHALIGLLEEEMLPGIG